MKLRIAGMVTAALVLLPGVASAQWYDPEGRRTFARYKGVEPA